MTGFVFGWVLRFTHSQKAVLVRNRCVKFAFNNGSFGAYFSCVLRTNDNK